MRAQHFKRSSMSKIRLFKKSRQELTEELRDIHDELIEANRAYDNGKFRRAKRISSAVSRLFHDGRAQSLTTQLTIKREMCLPDGLYARGGLKDAGFPLCVLKMSSKVEDWRYDPICNSEHAEDLPYSAFTKWWTGRVFSASSGSLSREQIVKIMRNKEEDHIESEIREEAYVSMKLQDDTAIKLYSCKDDWFMIEAFGRSPLYISPRVPKDRSTPPIISGPHPIPCAEFATMRQIGWEVEMALGSILEVLNAGGD